MFHDSMLEVLGRLKAGFDSIRYSVTIEKSVSLIFEVLSFLFSGKMSD